MSRKRFWATAAATVVSIGLPGPSLAATLNVPGDFATIQACIDAAVSGVDECVAAPGTYHETINFLGKAITLRSSGGADVTTIDATGLGGSVVTCATAESSDTVLDGFTITGGTGADHFGNGYSYGGGMLNDYSSPTVTNCTFSGNTAYAGGGIYNWVSSSTVTDSTFSANSAGGGGGGGGMANIGGRPAVTDCTFDSNSATGNVGYGGGIYNNGSGLIVRRCTFTGNVANNGGAMFNEFSSPTVSNCTFSANSGRSGGAMLNIYWSSPKVTNCTIARNRANLGGGGGMLSSSHSSPRVTTCTFSGNTADFGGGGMSAIFDSNPTVTNCTFWVNSAAQGGGLESFKNSNPTVANCILWGNTDSSGTGESAQVHTAGGAPMITYSIVQGGWNGASGIGVLDADPVFVDPDGPDGIAGTEDDNLRLMPGSPAISAGNNDALPPDLADLDGDGDNSEPTPTDLEGHARVLCGRVDMGAYEFGIGDYYCDQAVNLNDFAGWSSCMNGPQATALADEPPVAPGCEAFDFDGDGDVDLADFAAFQRVLTAP